MKGKKNTYILLSAALFVWGMIIYKVYMALYGGPEKNEQEYVAPVDGKKTEAEDSVVLFLNYRDPFLGSTVISPEEEPVSDYKPSVVAEKNISQPKEEIVWPKVSYHGLIFSRTSKNYVGILKINGKEISLKENQQFNGVTLLKAEKNQAKVKFKNEIKIVEK